MGRGLAVGPDLGVGVARGVWRWQLGWELPLQLQSLVPLESGLAYRRPLQQEYRPGPSLTRCSVDIAHSTQNRNSRVASRVPSHDI